VSHLCVNTLPASWQSVYTNVGPYIYDVSISGFTRSSIYIYIYDISSLRVNMPVDASHPYKKKQRDKEIKTNILNTEINSGRRSQTARD